MLTLITRTTLVALLAGLLQLVGAGPATATAPQGDVNEFVSNSPGSVTVTGWTFDPDDPSRAVEVHVYVGPHLTGLGPANVPREDVRLAYEASYPTIGNNHGFNATFDVPVIGDLEWAVYAIETDGGPNVLIEQGRVTIADPTITGAVANWESKVHRTIDLAGWASDSDAPTTPVRIEAYVGGNYFEAGVEGTALSASTSRSDGKLGFSGRLSTAKTGTQPVYVWAKNIPGTPGADRLIGVFSVTIYVDTTPPETTITSAPKTATTDELIHVTFSSNEPNSTFQCRWDEEPWFTCADGTSVKLTAGNHRIAVRATDAYKNTDKSPAVWVITVTQAPTPTDPNAPTPTDPGTQTPGNQTGRSIVAKAVKKKSRLRINVGPDSATTNYRVIIQRKVGKKWRKVTRARTRGPKDIVTINLKRGKYRAVLPKSSAGKALRSNTIRLKR